MIPDLSIVIPCRDDDKGLFLTMANAHELAQHEGLSRQIVVVASYGCGLRPDILFPKTVVVPGRFDSPAKSRDAGIAAATAPVLAILDSHVVMQKGVLSAFAAQIGSGAAVVAPVQHTTNIPGNQEQPIYDFALRWEGPRIWYARDWNTAPDGTATDTPYSAGFVHACCQGVSREFYLRHRSALRDLPYGPEEVILSGLGWLEGMRTAVVPNLNFYHYHGTERRAVGEIDHAKIDRAIRERVDLVTLRRALTERGIRT